MGRASVFNSANYMGGLVTLCSATVTHACPAIYPLQKTILSIATMSSVNSNNPQPSSSEPSSDPARAQDPPADSEAKDREEAVDLRTDPVDPRFVAWIDATQPEPEEEQEDSSKPKTQTKN
ncbi:hypothetical protein F5B20DRAFT_586713 [Whalleya microplaca]|nr:hypothetical protein F5B20DRAFT_586713 [Whalleya microplaca]